MIDWFKRVNGLNPQFRKVCGFLPCFEADFEAMNQYTMESGTADFFEMLYSSQVVEVYMLRFLRKDRNPQFHDVRLIAHNVKDDKYIVKSGLIAVNHKTQLKPHIRRAKKDLIRFISEKWNITFPKKD